MWRPTKHYTYRRNTEEMVWDKDVYFNYSLSANNPSSLNVRSNDAKDLITKIRKKITKGLDKIATNKGSKYKDIATKNKTTFWLIDVAARGETS